MRVALSVTEFPAVSQTFVLDHAVGLIERGHVVDLHALRPGSAAALHAEVERYGLMARTHYAPPPSARASASSRILALLRHCGTGFLAHPRLALALLRQRSVSRYEHILRCFSFWDPRRRYELIHAHSGQNGVRLLPLYAAGHLKAPLVVTFHGHDVHGYLRDRPRDFYRPLFAQASALVVCSGFMRERLVQLGAPPDKLHVIPNGIAAPAVVYQPRRWSGSGRLKLLTIGRLVPFKGLTHLLAALSLPAVRHVDFELHIVGDGPLRESLQAQAAALGERVIFHGACPRDQVLALLGQSDLYLAPAVVDEEGNTETQGVALLEAMAGGLPVIASAVGGIPETLGDAAVALVPPGAPQALADAIAAWSAGGDPNARCSQRGRARIENYYQAQAWISRLEALYSAATTKTS